jgi:hypothetical protein
LAGLSWLSGLESERGELSPEHEEDASGAATESVAGMLRVLGMPVVSLGLPEPSPLCDGDTPPPLEVLGLDELCLAELSVSTRGAEICLIAESGRPKMLAGAWLLLFEVLKVEVFEVLAVRVPECLPVWLRPLVLVDLIWQYSWLSWLILISAVLVLAEVCPLSGGDGDPEELGLLPSVPPVLVSEL